MRKWTLWLKNRRWSTFVIGLLLISAVIMQLLPAGGVFYSACLYPIIGSGLSWFSDLFSFSLNDSLYLIFLLLLILYPVIALQKRVSRKRVIINLLKIISIIYIWFYLAWGLNYSQADIYQRTALERCRFDKQEFIRFSESFIAKLNNSYTRTDTIDVVMNQKNSVLQYTSISREMGIHAPFHQQPRAKTMLFTPISSRVAVLGSMGPFMGEFTINGEVPPTQYPFVYAHEYAHRLGISSEAEANFYAYLACTRSVHPSIRFSGYLETLPYLLRNAESVLNEEEFKKIISQIDSRIKQEYNRNREYWQNRYSPLAGKIKNQLYDWYLKWNKIPEGHNNYFAVIGLIISYENQLKKR